jgi:hypothetical protein
VPASPLSETAVLTVMAAKANSSKLPPPYFLHRDQNYILGRWSHVAGDGSEGSKDDVYYAEIFNLEIIINLKIMRF